MRTLQAIALENAVEGQVRETYGAAVAWVQAERAEDPALRALYAVLARDETSPAALSLDLARWFETRLSAEDVLCVRGAREAARVELRTQVRESSAVEGDAALGIPTGARATALLDVVLPGAWDVSCERAQRTPRTRTT